MTTLAIASISSIAAALFIHKFWTGGAILGAGITPIIVAVVSESLKKPQQALAARRETRPSVMRGTPDAMPVEPTRTAPRSRDDRFGIWEDERGAGGGRFHKLRGRPLKLAIATGVVAFVIGAFLLTGAELVFGGGGGGGGGDRLTIVPGKQQKSDDAKTKTTETTEEQPSEETQTAPEEELTDPQTEAVPTVPPTTPAAPEEQVPPVGAQPAPETPVPPTTVPAEPAPAG